MRRWRRFASSGSPHKTRRGGDAFWVPQRLALRPSWDCTLNGRLVVIWVALWLYISGVLFAGNEVGRGAAFLFPLWPLAFLLAGCQKLIDRLPHLHFNRRWRVKSLPVKRHWGWTIHSGALVGLVKLSREWQRTTNPTWRFDGLAYRAYCFGVIRPLPLSDQSPTVLGAPLSGNRTKSEREGGKG